MTREISNHEDLKRAFELVGKVFSEFVAVDYSERGKNTFESYLEKILQDIPGYLEAGNKKVWGYYQKGEIIGVLAIRDTSHISIMFVDKRYHRKGIAKKLLTAFLEELRENKEVKQITVNSSPYAVKIYEHLGFVKTGEQCEREDGIIFTPMMRFV